jgi:hypothetical protein
MARRLSFFNFLIFTLTLYSCGDFWTADTANISDGRQMGLERYVVTILEGEQYAIPVWFTPDSLYNATVYWETEDDDIATFHNDTLLALTPGLTRVFATSTIDRLSDTCWVQVLPHPQMDWGDFPYEMMLYASVSLHGRPLTVENQDSVIIAAYVDDDLRGVGQMREAKGREYFVMRIGAYRPSGDQLRLRCYYRGRALAEWFPQVLSFDGEALGTLSNLFPLVIDNSAEVYQPDIDDLLYEEPIYEDPDTVVMIGNS